MKSIPYPLRGGWLISDEGASLVRGVWETAHTTGRAERIALALEARDGAPFPTDSKITKQDDVAVLSIDGPLMRKAELFTDISGATSYQWIGSTVDALRADTSIKKVVIKFNSPGGEAAGCGECGEKIARLAAIKRVEAYVETQAASAAWWLASQCTHITAHPTAQVGWIGAIKTIVDDAGRDEKNGVKRIEVVSDGAAKKRSLPVNRDVVARAQREVDEFGRLFTEAVASGRGVTTDYVLEHFGGGEGLFAEAAKQVGMIDAIDDFESLVASLAKQPARGAFATRTSTGVNKMNVQNVRAADADNEWKCGGCSEMMGPSATKFCSKCAADDDDDDDDDHEEESKALGLDPKSTRAARLARAVSLVETEQKLLAFTKAPSVAAAYGTISAGVLALSEVETQRVAIAAQKDAALQQEARAVLADKRLSLGHLTALVPTFLSSTPGADGAPSKRMKLQTAIAAMPAQTREHAVAAYASIGFTEDELASVKAFASLQPGSPPTPHVEPPLDTKNRLHIVNVSKEEAAKFGMKPESFEEYANINSVDQIKRPAPKP